MCSNLCQEGASIRRAVDYRKSWRKRIILRITCERGRGPYLYSAPLTPSLFPITLKRRVSTVLRLGRSQWLINPWIFFSAYRCCTEKCSLGPFYKTSNVLRHVGNTSTVTQSIGDFFNGLDPAVSDKTIPVELAWFPKGRSIVSPECFKAAPPQPIVIIIDELAAWTVN